MKYRKKPVVIEAEQFTQERLEAYLFNKEPLPPGLRVVQSSYHPSDRKVWGFTAGIETLEGFMKANIGDWIITGVKGEHYPCKPDIFAATYEPANVTAAIKLDQQGRDEPVAEVKSVQPGDRGSYGVVRFLVGDPNDMWSFPLPGAKLFLSSQSANPTIKESLTVAEPVAYMSEQGKESLRQFGQSSVVSGSARSMYTEFIHGLITTEQAEAYKDSCVREALEEAAQPSVPDQRKWNQSLGRDDAKFTDGWNACREAMLKGQK